MRSEEHYVVITGDLVGSSRLVPQEREALQVKLLRALDACNRQFAHVVVVPFSVSLGDEIQGMVRSLPLSFEIASILRRKLFPHRVRIGIGLGPVSTSVRKTTGAMDGQCFHRSRAALQRSKKERERALSVYDTGNEFLDIAVNSILYLVDVIQEDWKELHARRFWAYQDLGGIREVAEKERVSKAAVSKSLGTAKYRAVLMAMDSVTRLLSIHGDSAREPPGVIPSLGKRRKAYKRKPEGVYSRL
jgi:hypothetical protein